MADIWDIIDRVGADDASFFASVPHYTDGYRKMFRTPNLAWNEGHWQKTKRNPPTDAR